MRSMCLALSVLSCSCATAYTLSTDRIEADMARDKSMPQSLPRIYGGTLIDGWCLGQVTRGGADIGQSVFLCLLDMPLSLVGDTCLRCGPLRGTSPRLRPARRSDEDHPSVAALGGRPPAWLAARIALPGWRHSSACRGRSSAEIVLQEEGEAE